MIDQSGSGSNIERRLRESEARLRLLTEASSDVLYRMSPDWGEMKELDGGSFLPSTCLTAPLRSWLLAYIPDTDQALVTAAIEEAIRHKALFSLEHRVLRSDGTVGWTLSRAVPLLGPDGEIVEWFGAASDISNRREAEVALRESETRLREFNETLEREVNERTAERDRIWEISPDLQLVIDFRGVFRRVNPAWTKLLGYTPDELVGHHVNDFVLPDDHGETVKAYETAAHGGHPRIENRYRHKDGSKRWISWVAAPAGDMIYATGRDVTGQRQTEEQLRQSQKMEALGQLTGGIAHDFNNLLTVIRGSAELLQRPDLSFDKRRRFAEAIADTADRGSKLTSQLLSFARRQALTPAVFDVAASLAAISDMVGTLTGSRIVVETDVGDGSCHVNADRTQFDTAIVNLAVNARDAMGGEGRLLISTRLVNNIPAVRTHPSIEGDFVAVTLTDTGPGIPADKFDRIFEPFFTTKDVGQGTGLGLSQVFGFAKQSGGEVIAKNADAGGASFTLYMPLAVGPADQLISKGISEVASSGSGMSILVVEDNLEVGEFATQALAELGYSTRWVVSGKEALLELAAANDFDLVLSDVVMPGMSGIELGRELVQRYPHLPVVLTSGFSEAVVQTGVSGFPLLHKPYSIGSLSQIIQANIQGSRGLLRSKRRYDRAARDASEQTAAAQLVTAPAADHGPSHRALRSMP